MHVWRLLLRLRDGILNIRLRINYVELNYHFYTICIFFSNFSKIIHGCMNDLSWGVGYIYLMGSGAVRILLLYNCRAATRQRHGPSLSGPTNRCFVLMHPPYSTSSGSVFSFRRRLFGLGLLLPEREVHIRNTEYQLLSRMNEEPLWKEWGRLMSWRGPLSCVQPFLQHGRDRSDWVSTSETLTLFLLLIHHTNLRDHGCQFAIHERLGEAATRPESPSSTQIPRWVGIRKNTLIWSGDCCVPNNIQ